MAARAVMVNLLPPELQPPRPSSFRRLGKVAGVLLLGGILMLYPAFLVAGRATAEDLRDVEEELASYLPREQEARALEERINTLRRQKAEMEAVVRERRKWSELLEELGAALPAQVWMTELEVASSGEILFTGRATSLAAVGKFLAAVQSLPFWQEVELRSVQAVPEDKTLLEFTIRAAFAES